MTKTTVALLLCIFFQRTLTLADISRDCIILKNDQEVCGAIKLKTDNFWIKNEVRINDSITINLADVKKISYDGKVLLRATQGRLLSNFAVLREVGRLSLYEKKDSFQANAHTYYSPHSKYFSIDNEQLFYFNLSNLRKQLKNCQPAQEHLLNANTKKVAAFCIRLSSAIPFMIGIINTEKSTASYLVPFGIGITMLTAPAFTIKPAIKRDISNAIKEFNNNN